MLESVCLENLVVCNWCLGFLTCFPSGRRRIRELEMLGVEEAKKDKVIFNALK